MNFDREVTDDNAYQGVVLPVLEICLLFYISPILPQSGHLESKYHVSHIFFCVLHAYVVRSLSPSPLDGVAS